MPKSSMDKEIRFKFYLDDSGADEQQKLIDMVETVCAGVFRNIASFDVLRIGNEPSLSDVHRAEDNIAVSPTLARVSPLPEHRFFGDFSDPERLHRLLSEDRRETLILSGDTE